MIDRNLLTLIRKEIDQTLLAVAEKHGVAIEAGRCTFTATHATMKLEISARSGVSGEVITKEAEDFKRYAASFGLKEKDLNRKIQYGGAQYQIVGLKPRCRKFPVLARRGDGKLFKLAVSVVK